MQRDNFWHFLAKFWPEKITSRDGCFLPIFKSYGWELHPLCVSPLREIQGGRIPAMIFTRSTAFLAEGRSRFVD